MAATIEQARMCDVAAITELVNRYAEQNITLPRTEESVRQTLADWRVAIETGGEDSSERQLVGCGALVPLTERLIEIRSLAIDGSQQGKGIGKGLVLELVALARERGFLQVCALTLTENFFIKLGFELVDRWSISPKVWQACIYCPKFHRCDEVAVLMNLAPVAEEASPTQKAAGWNSLMRWGAWQPLKLAFRRDDQHEQ